MSRTIYNDGLALLQHGEQAQPGPITQAQEQGLPAVAQQYLSYAGVLGKDPIRTVHLAQQGVMRTQPGQKWLPFVAQQYFTTNPPAFLWHATMRLFPFVWISAMDRFSQGHGNMRIKLLSVIPMGNARGSEMDQSEMQRYLAEMLWFPAAWLSEAIEWQAIDAHSVKAIMRASGVTATVVLHVNDQGQLTRVTADRYKEEHGRYLLTPWSGQCDEYQDVEGMRIPTRIAITWHLASGDFTCISAIVVFISGGAAAYTGATLSPILGLMERITIGGFLQWLFVTALKLYTAQAPTTSRKSEDVTGIA